MISLDDISSVDTLEHCSGTEVSLCLRCPLRKEPAMKV